MIRKPQLQVAGRDAEAGPCKRLICKSTVRVSVFRTSSAAYRAMSAHAGFYSLTGHVVSLLHGPQVPTFKVFARTWMGHRRRVQPIDAGGCAAHDAHERGQGLRRGRAQPQRERLCFKGPVGRAYAGRILPACTHQTQCSGRCCSCGPSTLPAHCNGPRSVVPATPLAAK